jgi:hypothetical protein
MYTRNYLKLTIIFFVAFFMSFCVAWWLCNYRLLLAVFIFGLYFAGGVGFFPFKTAVQKIINVGVIIGAATGLILFLQRYIA